jgi:hypothetical protein
MVTGVDEDTGELIWQPYAVKRKMLQNLGTATELEATDTYVPFRAKNLDFP